MATTGGKDHFRPCWTQKPVYSGGAVSALIPTAEDGEALLAMAFGCTFNILRASDGSVVASYDSPLEEDVIIHLAVNGNPPPPRNADDEDQGAASSSADAATALDGFEAIGLAAFSTESRQIYAFALHWDRMANEYKLKLIKSWTAAQHAISCLRFTPSGSHIASGATDGGLKVWDVHHHHVTHNYKGKGGIVTAFNFSPSGDLMAAGTVEGYVSIIDFDTKEVIITGRPTPSPVEALGFQTDGSLTSVGRDRRVALYSPRTLDEKKTIVLRDHVGSAAFVNDADFFVGTPEGVLVQLYLSADGNVAVRSRTTKAPHANELENAIRSITFVPGAFLSRDDSERQAAKRSRAEADNSSAHATDVVLPIVVVSDASQRLHFIRPLQRSAPSVPEGLTVLKTFCGYLDQIYDIRLLPPLAAATRPPQLAAALKTNGLRHDDGVEDDDDDVDQEQVIDRDFPRVIASNSKDLMVFRTTGIELATALQGHSDIVTTCDVSADGRFVVSGSKDTTMRLWDLKTSRCVGVGAGHSAGLTCTIINPKMSTASTFLVISTDGEETIKLWNANAAAVSGWQPVQTIANAHLGAIHCAAFAPNDAYLATGGKDKLVNLWAVKGRSLAKVGSFQGHRRTVNAVCFAPADRVLASASNDGSIKLWSLTNMTCAKTLTHDKVGITQLKFFNGGHQLLTGNALGVLRVWAVAAGEVVATLEAHQDRIWALAIEERGDNTVFFTGGADSTLVAHEDYTAEQVQKLREDRTVFILATQKLLNAIRRKDWPEAVRLALALKHPRHLRTVLFVWMADDETACEDGLTDIIASASSADLAKLLEFTRIWIVNARHSAAAAIVIAALLRAYHFSELRKMPAVKETMEALVGYNKRHEARVTLLLNQLHYVDYLTRSLRPVGILSPQHDGDVDGTTVQA